MNDRHPKIIPPEKHVQSKKTSAKKKEEKNVDLPPSEARLLRPPPEGLQLFMEAAGSVLSVAPLALCSTQGF